jgi:ubiquinone/menaquinone biosynthesis C-methylase UbiE
MKESEQDHPAAYGENCAEFYDQIYNNVDPKLLQSLVQLANGGRVLELGIGTGRVALSLTAQGVAVSGIEASEAMLQQLSSKAGADQLQVTKGNFAECLVEGYFKLVFALVSTFYLLSSAEEQQRCFHSVARVLAPGGILLLENYEPSGRPLQRTSGNPVYLFEQQVATVSGLRSYRSRICYASPSELDVMASRAGLQLIERWGDWVRRPYKPRDPMHISIYERD